MCVCVCLCVRNTRNDIAAIKLAGPARRYHRVARRADAIFRDRAPSGGAPDTYFRTLTAEIPFRVLLHVSGGKRQRAAAGALIVHARLDCPTRASFSRNGKSIFIIIFL